ncbi:hypothetical protein [Litorisediminicola beolgyonensis]|uniref:DUF4383 domain-containing protein n=1 Tax=Litorisediminicola beolgyonensis TaxID=1173614 RepID=A0ABW3ZLG2_9RHOB
MGPLRTIALGYAVVLFGAAALNYIPGVTDADGVAFGIFALDLYDDALHAASALWALIAGLTSRRAARLFLVLFGALYLGDGLLGLATGSGYLDLGIFTNGVLDLEFGFKILANLPHIALGGIALISGLVLERDKA